MIGKNTRDKIEYSCPTCMDTIKANLATSNGKVCKTCGVWSFVPSKCYPKASCY